METIGHYRLLERLGTGGLGEVYKAQDLLLGRIVAIKFLRADSFLNGTSERCLLEREAKAAAELNHPHIATIHELGNDNHTSYIVMEYVAGVTVAEKIKQGPLEVRASLEIAIQVAEALKAAHSRGLIHCDLTPSNIMLLEDDHVKVLDFGLARLSSAVMKTDDSPFEGGVGRCPGGMPEGHPPQPKGCCPPRGGISGTIDYLSPEQARGEPLDAGTDLFSLGVVLYEMITSRPPFEGVNATTVLAALLNEEPRPLGAFRDDIPLELENIVRKALAKNRTARYHSPAEIISDLKKILNQLAAGPIRASEKQNGNDGEAVGTDTRGVTLGLKQRLRNRLPLWLNSYRRWFLTAGVLAVAGLGLDVLLLHSQGMGWGRDSLFLLVSALGFLLYKVPRLQVSKRVLSLPQGAAFRGLLPFQEADRDRFYGRDIDISAVLEKVMHREFRFGVLYGDSGCGKTSLIQAGILPRLREEGYVAVYCRSYKDPVAALVENSRRQNLMEVRPGESPSDYLRHLSQTLTAEIVIVFDQFEEFFTNFRSRADREPLVSFLAHLVNDESFPVKVLLSMRSDFLYLINSEFGGKIENPLLTSKLYHLQNLDRERAEEIIKRSTGQANLPFERSLCSQVARDLAVNDMVLPSELQVVGEQLQSKHILTLPEYRAAGGKESLVHSYLEDVIQASGDQETARLLLRSLISDQNTRLTLTLEDLCRRTQRGRNIVEPVLSTFVHSRLIREIQEDEPWRYELMHEYLIERVHRVTGRVLDATQRANHLFRQCLSNYSLDKAARIPLSKWNFIRRYSDLPRGERERELLRKSLHQGLVKAGLLSLLLTAGAVLFTAYFSSTPPERRSQRLSTPGCLFS
jgi:serine/threonine protein kinase